MNLDNQELDFTKTHRNMVRYTKLAGAGKGLTSKQFLEFYHVYCELYDLLCEYMNAYNRECADYEQTIDELYEEKERLKEELDFQKNRLVKLAREYEIINKQNEIKNEVTENELKDMIIGMLE